MSSGQVCCCGFDQIHDTRSNSHPIRPKPARVRPNSSDVDTGFRPDRSSVRGAFDERKIGRIRRIWAWHRPSAGRSLVQPGHGWPTPVRRWPTWGRPRSVSIRSKSADTSVEISRHLPKLVEPGPTSVEISRQLLSTSVQSLVELELARMRVNSGQASLADVRRSVLCRTRFVHCRLLHIAQEYR